MSTENSKEYVLSHITDLLNVPDEDLDNMLDELKDTIRTLKLSWNAIKDIEEKNGKTIRDVIPSITWVSCSLN